MAVGEVIKAAREPVMTQVMLATALGVDQSEISRWERGHSLPTIADLVAIDRALNRPSGSLFFELGLIDEVPAVEAALRADDKISDADRRRLIEAYREALREHRARANRASRRRATGR